MLRPLTRRLRERAHRAALLAAVLLVSVVACAGTAATGGAPDETTEAQADLIARLPAEITTVGFLDFAAVRGSEFYAYLQREAIAGADPDDLEALLGETGIDPATDVHRVAFVSSAMATGDGAEDTTGVIVLASFDRQRILEALQDNDTAQYGDYTLYEVAHWRARDDVRDDASADDERDATMRAHVVLLDDSTLAFGSEAVIRAIVDVAGGSPSARTNSRLMELLEDVDADSEAWVVSAQDALLSGLQPGDNDIPLGQIPVDRINALIVSVQLTEGIRLRLRGRTDAEEDAKLLGDSLNGMLAFGKMMIQGNSPDVFAIIDRGFSAGSSGRDVTVRADLTLDDIETLRAYGEELGVRSGLPGL